MFGAKNVYCLLLPRHDGPLGAAPFGIRISQERLRRTIFGLRGSTPHLNSSIMVAVRKEILTLPKACNPKATRKAGRVEWCWRLLLRLPSLSAVELQNVRGSQGRKANDQKLSRKHQPDQTRAKSFVII
jgi:hypothetical protein